MMEGLNFTIAKKMMLFAIVIFVTILITGLLKFNNLLNTEKNFNIFKDKAVAGKFYVLEVNSIPGIFHPSSVNDILDL